MPKKVDEDELQFRERMRDAVQVGGKSGLMAKKTGIPVGTLNKYVALISTPSAVNAMKIANALGITVEQLARGDLTATLPHVTDHLTQQIAEQVAAFDMPLASVDNPTLGLRRRIMRDVKALYKASGLITPDEDDKAVAAMEMFNALTQLVRDMTDEKEIDLALALLMYNLERELKKAVVYPGSSKRSA